MPIEAIANNAIIVLRNMTVLRNKIAPKKEDAFDAIALQVFEACLKFLKREQNALPEILPAAAGITARRSSSGREQLASPAIEPGIRFATQEAGRPCAS